MDLIFFVLWQGSHSIMPSVNCNHENVFNHLALNERLRFLTGLDVSELLSELPDSGLWTSHCFWFADAADDRNLVNFCCDILEFMQTSTRLVYFNNSMSVLNIDKIRQPVSNKLHRTGNRLVHSANVLSATEIDNTSKPVIIKWK